MTESPDFRPVPNRWIVTRRLDMNKIRPLKAPIPQYESWIVESDCVRNLNTLRDDVDLEVDVTPFISVSPEDMNSNGDSFIEGQAETFIGMKLPILDWDTANTDALPHIDLHVLGPSNSACLSSETDGPSC